MAEAPAELLADPEVPYNAKAAAAVLWSVVRRDDPEPTWWETMAKLAERLGVSERQAKRAHQTLVDAGWAGRYRAGFRFATRLFPTKRSVVVAPVGSADHGTSTDRCAVDREAVRTAQRCTTYRPAVHDVPPNGTPVNRLAVRYRAPTKPQLQPQLHHQSPEAGQAVLQPVVAVEKRKDPVRELWEWYEDECVRRGYGRKRRKLSPEQRRRVSGLLAHIGKTLGVDQAGAIESQRQHLQYRFARADKGERDREWIRGNTPWVATATNGRTPWWDFWHTTVEDRPTAKPRPAGKSALQRRTEEIRRQREESERG